ncbi:hypothetical protein QWY90_10505 [Flavobacterium paronense]|uniref:Fibronectin type III domain-containing protein n=1 Tax=Flavobacterium paronense TaxID=1392775 RepID=A0ABV5GBW8_9FLAO|nr:hypothetical protein [Flavobacterium paronense]MDN3677748.1 hypothetical protein [Flavobacterium paronense]
MIKIFTPNLALFKKKQFFVFFSTAIFILVNQFSFSQVSTYGFGESISSYTALTSPSTAYTAPWDDHVLGSAFLAPIGFTFNYEGVNQTQCYISPNGFISFGVQPTPTNYLPLSVATPYTNGGAISALGRDLISGTPTDNIVYSTIGTSPNRVFVVQWTNAARKIAPGNFNFQIRLNETTNVIEILYGVCSPTVATTYDAQVGIRGVNNSFLQGDINNRLQGSSNINVPWSGKTINGTANSSTVRTSITEYPNSGLKYTYTPSTNCVTPTGVPSAFSVGTTSVTATSFVGNSFTAAVPSPTNYLILRSTVNTAPTNIQIPNRVYWAVNDVISATYTVVSISNATTFTQTGLTPNTVYYYWAIPYNSGCIGGPFYNLSSMISTSKTTCISEPLSVASSSIGGNSFTASWNAVTGATDYAIDVSTTNTFSTLLPGYSNASTSNSTSLSIIGLSPLTTYYFRVRAVGLSCNTNSLTVSATTLCGAFPIPYFQNFDATPVNTLPTCFTVANDNADGVAWQVQNTLPASSPNSYHLATNTASTDDWFFTPGLNLLTSVTYRLKFKYNTLTAGLFSEDLKVRIGSGASAAGMNITILDLPGFVNTVYQTAIVDFTPIADGVFYLGFQGNSSANQSKILIDDISVIVSPTCFEPDNIVVNSVGINDVTISWDPPLSPPSNGYDYYVSNSNSQPAITATPTGSVGVGVNSATITGLSAATLYYVWVRGNCGGSDSSVWSLYQTFSTDCSTSNYLSVTNGVLCGGGSTTLTATASSGSVIEWFADSAGTILLGTGNSFVTPTLSATTSYYAQSKAPGGLVTVGPVSPLSHGGSLGTSTTPVKISFSVIASTNLQSIDIYPLVSGQSGTFTIRNSSDVIIASYPYFTSVAGGNTPQTINFNIDLTPGTYKLSTDVLPTSGLLINVVSNDYSSYTSSVANLLGTDNDNSTYWYAYNWKLSNICKSLLTKVDAVITTAPVISLSQTSATICSGETIPLVTVSGSTASYTTFVWTPSTGIVGSIGAGYTFSPTITTLYTLTASQSSGSLCVSNLSFTVTVNPEPPPITVVPATATICQGQTQLLTSSLATATQVTIYEETFNGANSWTTYNSSTGGTIANSDWTLRNSVYSYTGTWSGGINLSSNDASRFYFTNSDAQGSSPGSPRTRTYLESPTINLAAYNTASLSFWHYLRLLGGNIARVEASINGGTTWTTVSTQTSSTPAVNSMGFVNVTVSLNSLVGNPAVKFRFYFDAFYGYGWAVDNFKITGNLALEVNWSPVTNLYFDSAATNPYIAGTPASFIYAKPNGTITYTGTALGANGCSTSSTATITVQPSVTTGTLSANQTICSAWLPNDLILTAFSGPIVRWEYATNATFTTGLTSITNTTSTLTSAIIGSFSGTRYYRVVLQSGSCPLVYSNSVSITFVSTTWNGTAWSNGLPNSSTRAIFNGSFSSTTNLQACSVEVISGTVVFNTGHTLTVQNDVRVTGGSLTFDNNSSLVQVNSLDNNGIPISNTGNITYKRVSTPMFKFDYTYWSSPVSPQILLDVSPLSPTSLFLQFNSATNSWQYISNPGTTSMVSGKGYIWRAPTNFPIAAPATPQAFTANFIGVPNTGTITIPTTGVASQFNLLGNPYPSALSADAFLLDASNAATLSGTLYFWTHNTPLNASYQYTGSDYAIYNYLGGVVGGVPSGATNNPGVSVLPPNGKIASGQGFFIKGLSNGNATFKNTMRIAGNNDQFFKMTTPNTTVTSEIEKHRYWINVYNTQGAFKQVLLGYVDGATMGLDRLFDGEMVDVGNAITLYSKVDDTKLSIQGRPLPFDVNDYIPLGYKSTIASTYNISLIDYDGLFTTQNIYLEDKILNIIYDLKNGPYSFTTSIGTFDDRFVLRYTTETLGNLNPVFNENTVVIYKNKPSNEFEVSSGNIMMSTLKVFDIRGRLLLEKNNINSLQTNFSIGLTNEVLLVQIKSVDGIVVTKKVIN